MPKPDFTPTDEQQAVVVAVAGKDSVMVEAYAGCSKSTTLQLSAPKIRLPALALAFNKKIATDLKGLMPGNFEVKTFNGLGHGAWMRANPQVSTWTLDDKKLGKLVSAVAKGRQVDLSSEQWDQLRRLVTGVMAAGIVPGNVGDPLKLDHPDSWAAVADGLWIPEGDFEFLYDMARQTLAESISMARQGVISFDDQVYCSACLGGVFPKFPVMFVDEAQDLSPLNHHQLRQAMRDDGRLVAVGDTRQAIYGFRGSDSNSMKSMRQLRPDWTDRGLTTTFRCPKVVVARQQSHAPGFSAWHTNAEGSFAHWRAPYDSEEPFAWTWQQLFDALPTPNATLAVLCRNNAPLLALAFKLLRQGVGVVMLGRDIGKGLVALSRKIAKDDGTAIELVVGRITEWKESEQAKAVAEGHDDRVAGVIDRAECLLAVAESSGVVDAGALRTALEKLFSRDYGRVTLASIHKAKGLEWDCVLHLDPWRIPSKQAKKAAAEGDERQLVQEWNLRYVLETRTKHTLLTANLEDFE